MPGNWIFNKLLLDSPNGRFKFCNGWPRLIWIAWMYLVSFHSWWVKVFFEEKLWQALLMVLGTPHGELWFFFKLVWQFEEMFETKASWEVDINTWRATKTKVVTRAKTFQPRWLRPLSNPCLQKMGSNTSDELDASDASFFSANAKDIFGPAAQSCWRNFADSSSSRVLPCGLCYSLLLRFQFFGQLLVETLKGWNEGCRIPSMKHENRQLELQMRARRNLHTNWHTSQAHETTRQRFLHNACACSKLCPPLCQENYQRM